VTCVGVLERGVWNAGEGTFNNKKITYINCFTFTVYLGDNELGVCGSLTLVLRILERNYKKCRFEDFPGAQYRTTQTTILG
jgi:hypothetical protein